MSTTYRYRVELDDHDPVSDWADQPCHTDGLTDDERDRWLGRSLWESYVVFQERRCECCGSWNTEDVVGGFDFHEDHRPERLPEGIVFELADLPTIMAEHFTEG